VSDLKDLVLFRKVVIDKAMQSKKLIVVGFVSVAVAACAQTKSRLPSSSTAAYSAAGHVLNEAQPIRYDYNPGEIDALCKSSIARAEDRLQAIAKIPAVERTFANTTLAYEGALADLSDQAVPLTFMGYVSTDVKMRAEAASCEDELGKYLVDVQSRRPIYQAIKATNPGNAEEKRLLQKTLEAFENNGLNLSDEKLEQVKKLNQRLATLQTQFSANLNNDTSNVTFDKSELAGLSDDFLAGLKRTADGKYLVNAKESDYVEFMQNASNSESRRKFLLTYQNRAADKNVPLLEEAIGIRQQIASLMGYPNWAEYRIHGRMAQDSATVLKFLGGLKEKLSRRNREELKGLLKLKKELDPSATDVKVWDTVYLSYQLKKRKFNLDTSQIRQYFPADTVIQGLFEVYSRILGVKFSEVRQGEQSVPTWSPDVKLYRISDEKGVIAYFYTDFFSRPGKYGHAAAFTLINGRRLENGEYSKPVSAIVANLKSPSNGKPSLLSHEEVETVFHEFGHIMHQTLTRAPYASLSGSSVAQDFVEAPSQMLENWVWTPQILNLLSGHYQDLKKKLPADMLKKMIEAKDFNQGMFYTRQLLLGLLDMTYHTTPGAVDTTEVYNRLTKEVMGIDAVPGGHFAASFGHLMGGYDSGYYGYLWSEVYAQDLFTRFKKALLSPQVGADYRRIVLERGNMADGQELLKEFLGRVSNQDAFFEMLHIRK
jgi:thimet oligopeptidase